MRRLPRPRTAARAASGALLAIGLFSTESRAQSSSASDVVVTGTRSPESSQRSIVPTRSVTREEAERRGASTVADALSQELGVQVNPSAYDYLGNPSGIQIQGIDGERVLILVDGERLIGDTGGVIDLESLPLTDVERIEFVSGPTSSLYGTGAIGGVVNIITGPPRFEGLSSRLKLEGRSFGGHTEQGSLALRDADRWLMFDGSYAFSPLLAHANGSSALPESKRALVGIRLGAEPVRDWVTRLKARVIRDELTGLSLIDRPGLGVFSVDTPELTYRYLLSTEQRLRVTRDSELRLSLSSQWFDHESKKLYRDSPVEEVRQRAHRLQSFEAISTTRESKRSWTFGFRGETEGFDQQLDKTGVAGNGDLTHESSSEVPKQTFGSLALYSQLDWRLGSGFALLPGVRGEWHSRYGFVAAPRLAASYKASSQWIFRAALGRGFRVPSAKEYGFAFDHSSLGYVVKGNPGLQPESSWGASGEAQYRAKSVVKFRLGAYANWVEDLIDTDFVGRDAVARVDTYSYINVGRARTWGYEAEVEMRVSSRLMSRVGYGYLDTYDVERQRPLVGRPPHTLKSSLDYRLTQDLELNLHHRLVSESYIDDGLTSPAFVSVGVRCAYQATPELKLHLGVENALNVQRQSARVGDQRPQRGATAYVGVVWATPE
ncbi:MAG: TonB-dependent receptor [Polyangiaceae bacterium]